MNNPIETDTRITVRLLDSGLESALDRYCAHKRRKKPDVLRNALVDLLEKEGYLATPAPSIEPDAEAPASEEGRAA